MAAVCSSANDTAQQSVLPIRFAFVVDHKAAQRQLTAEVPVGRGRPGRAGESGSCGGMHAAVGGKVVPGHPNLF